MDFDKFILQPKGGSNLITRDRLIEVFESKSRALNYILTFNEVDEFLPEYLSIQGSIRGFVYLQQPINSGKAIIYLDNGKLFDKQGNCPIQLPYPTRTQDLTYLENRVLPMLCNRKVTQNIGFDYISHYHAALPVGF
ncbi:MAG: hypothetical protein ACRCXZ_10925 [Patescibacteria group bacterium]